jgi:Lipocalin-like domain
MRDYPSRVETQEVLEVLIGAWRIRAIEDRDSASDPWVPYGPDPQGIIVYDASGTLSCHLVGNGLPAPSSEKYLGYWGTFAIADAHRDGEAIVGTLLHQMEGGHPPFLFEQEPERPFRLEGDDLVIGDGRTTRRVLERISNARS